MAVLPLRRGDTFVVNAAFKVSNVAQDMTGWTLEASMQFSNCDAIALTPSWVSQAGGTAKFRLSHEETATLEIGEYLLQVRTINPSGDRSSCAPMTVRVRE